MQRVGQMKCRLCGKVFRTGEFLDQHLDSRHANHTHQVSSSWQWQWCSLGTASLSMQAGVRGCTYQVCAPALVCGASAFFSVTAASHHRPSAACQAGVLCLLRACRAPPPGSLQLPSSVEVFLLQTVGVGLKLRLAQRPPKLLHGCRAQGPANSAGSAARPALWQRSQQRVSGQHPHAHLLHWRAASTTISCLEISAAACLTLQGASTCLADLRDLLHTQHLANAGGSVAPAALRRMPCKPSGAKRLRAQCEVRQVPRGQSCWLSCMNRSLTQVCTTQPSHGLMHSLLSRYLVAQYILHIMLLCMLQLLRQWPTCCSRATPTAMHRCSSLVCSLDMQHAAAEQACSAHAIAMYCLVCGGEGWWASQATPTTSTSLCCNPQQPIRHPGIPHLQLCRK